MGVHPASVAAFCSLFFGYVASATALQWWFYHRQGRTPRAWKSQPGALHAPHGRGLAWVWCLPFLDLLRSPPAAAAGVQPRHPLHPWFATLNLLVSSSFALASCELFQRSRGSLHSSCGPGHAACASQLLVGVLKSLALQSVLEYYWHALMHTPWCYAHLHRFHHFYKAPQVFDDLMIHPVEAFGYYCLLFCPSVLVRQHWAAFLVYMALCGVFGILDHSGIAVQLLGVYDTRAHDVHHQKGFGPSVYVNLAFPFTLMDVAHRTFVAPKDVGYK